MKLSLIIPLDPDRTLEIKPLLPKDIQLIVQKGPNPSKNRNQGILKAKGDIIAFANAHTLPPKNWHKKILNFFKKNSRVDILGGPQLTHPEESKFGKASGYALSSPFGAAEASTRYKKTNPKKVDERHLTSANLACRKKVLKKVRFNENIYPGEDPKFIADAKEQGFNIAYSPEIFVYHRRRQSLKELAKQIFNYGKVRPQKEPLLQTLKKPTFLAPPIFLLYIAVFPTLSLLHFVFAIPLLIYLILNISFSLYESIKNNNLSSLLSLPFIFLTIHLTYGLGFISGTLMKKQNKPPTKIK